VLRLVGGGQPNSAIAASLFIAETTVKTHVAPYPGQTRAGGQGPGRRAAYETGLVQPGEQAP